jgi:hypothetical protein
MPGGSNAVSNDHSRGAGSPTSSPAGSPHAGSSENRPRIVQPRNKKPSRLNARGSVRAIPSLALARNIGHSDRPGILASASSYSPCLPGDDLQWLSLRISSTVTDAGQRRHRTVFPGKSGMCRFFEKLCSVVRRESHHVNLFMRGSPYSTDRKYIPEPLS